MIDFAKWLSFPLSARWTQSVLWLAVKIICIAPEWYKMYLCLIQFAKFFLFFFSFFIFWVFFSANYHFCGWPWKEIVWYHSIFYSGWKLKCWFNGENENYYEQVVIQFALRFDVNKSTCSPISSSRCCQLLLFNFFPPSPSSASRTHLQPGHIDFIYNSSS